MTRRDILAAAAAAPLALAADSSVPIKLGIDLFSLRSQKWTPIEALDYCAARHVKLVHFSEIRFIGSLDPANLRSVRAHAAELGLEVEIGMKSICPSSTMFDPKAGTAEQQLTAMIEAAHIVGSGIVRCVLGSADDRKTAPIEKHIEDTVRVLHNIRARAMDRNVKIAIENHAGDMQARELKMLIEHGGPEFVGVCLDSGNPLWTLEDPHLTLDTLHPYVLTSHMRDSAVWRIPEGAAVTWVHMGQGNVRIAEYLKKYVALCPGRAVSIESIVLGPRKFAYHDPKFWDGYRDVRAWEFERYVEIAESGKPDPDEEPFVAPDQAARERADLDISLDYTKKVLGL